MAPKKKKPQKPSPPRNPFAGRPRGGAGFHDDKRYGKKERREAELEIEELLEDDAGEGPEEPPGN